jgi:hypothetical protein
MDDLQRPFELEPEVDPPHVCEYVATESPDTELYEQWVCACGHREIRIRPRTREGS